MESFFSLRYWIAARPDPNFQFTKLTVALAALLLIAGLVIKIYRKRYAKDEILKKMLKRYPTVLFVFGLALLVLLLFREGGIPLFSMRIWWLFYLILLVYWLLKNSLSFKKDYAHRKGQAHHHALQSQYLPKKKR